MKKINYATIKAVVLIYVMMFSVFTGILFAQQVDINGTFEGVRLQYDRFQSEFEKEFQYKYDLTQKGNQVEGISTIYNSNGDYAEVKIKGLVVGDKFYFEEYEMMDQMKASNSTWCYKSGVLDIITKDGEVWLTGKTKSYMVNYGYACTGGHTKLSKTDKNAVEKSGDIEGNVSLFEVSLYPNPTINQSNIAYTLDKSVKVVIEVFDINGKVISKVIDTKQDIGSHSNTIDLENVSAGLYIVKLSAGKEVYSEQLIKLKD